MDELRGLTKVISDELNFIFSLTDDQEEIRIYSLLERSYIDARYSLNYTLDKNDLLYIISKAEKLEKIALKLSEEKVKSLK
ncbi:hypothetical protein D3C80_1419350 [compost metagenome]